MSGDDMFKDDFEIGKEDSHAFEEAKTKLAKRCEAAGIETSEEEGWDEGTDLIIHMPAGRNKSRIFIADITDVRALMSFDFEKYHLLGEYMGICCYEEGTIEASLRPLGLPGSPSSFLHRQLFGNENSDDKTINPIVLKEPDVDDPVTISIGEPSDTLKAFESVCAGWRTRFSVLVTNSKARTHDKAVRTLECLANAIFFQIHLQLHVPLTLQRERPRRLHRTRRGFRGSKDDLKFPEREYEPQSMSLYWYAKSAVGMPLLQFLAYYQVLEFYMPTYSNHEAIGKVRNILKDPRFNADKDPQVARILALLRSSSRGFGDERSQLEAVLRRCVLPEELRKFYTEDAGIRGFFEDNSKRTAKQKVPLKNEASDLLSETAHRLYEIRCRIVHTKDHGDRDLAPLLPYSKEAMELYFDIALIEFIATAVLVASSTAIKV
ncbi:hypothetical protein KAR91_30030 [Candidatus Pacearchaeota archaeon]|nr:hypothetical protein [Candidatus Pacearchaeota archaeon]